jgi:hypothetical protein
VWVRRAVAAARVFDADGTAVAAYAGSEHRPKADQPQSDGSLPVEGQRGRPVDRVQPNGSSGELALTSALVAFRSRGSSDSGPLLRRQGNHEPVIVWQVEAIVRAALGSDVCWCASALTLSTRHAMTDGDTHPPRQPARAPVTQKRATAWGSMRARLANPAILAAMPLPLATSGRRTSSFSGRAGPRDRAGGRVR